jgi:A/G-specific adenine glycosylase
VSSATAQPQKPKSIGKKSRPSRVKGTSVTSLAAARLTPLLLAWFDTAARDLPWRRTLDPYAIWVSEIMLQQTQVKTVIPYWERWLRELPDIPALAAASEQRLLKLWEGLGYYTRVRNMQKAARQIISQHGAVFPREFDAILELPGVGRYTAGAIASIAFNQPAPILDGNVIRVLTRLFAIAENPREKAVNAQLWLLANQLVEAAAPLPQRTSLTSPMVFSGSCSVLNQSLMELGATVCTPQNPQCSLCPVRPHCAAHRAGRESQIPNLDRRAVVTHRQFHTFVVEHAGRFLVAQRPAGVVNAGLWEFPNLEIQPPRRSPAASLGDLLQLVAQCVPMGEIRHAITRYRITQHIFHVPLSTKPAVTKPPFQWHALDALHGLPFTSAHKRIVARCATLPPLPPPEAPAQPSGSACSGSPPDTRAGSRARTRRLRVE